MESKLTPLTLQASSSSPWSHPNLTEVTVAKVETEVMAATVVMAVTVTVLMVKAATAGTVVMAATVMVPMVKAKSTLPPMVVKEMAI